MDIMRHGAQVLVEAPASLRRRVAREATAVAASYGNVPRMDDGRWLG